MSSSPALPPDFAPLDDSVAEAGAFLDEAGVPTPNAIFLLGTGPGTLPTTWNASNGLPLGEVPGAPSCWRESQLRWARVGSGHLWFIEDSPTTIEWDEERGRHAWERSWPLWLAASAGATICVLTGAAVGLRGGLLESGEELPVGGFAVASDHVNLSGSTPLCGLGDTRLGPLFPDQSDLHHEGLRLALVERARSAGIDARPAVVACTLGPTVHTPAELRYLATTGAALAAQDLADPLIACAHAGLSTLALLAVIDDGSRPMSMEELVARCEASAPALDELLASLAPDCVQVGIELAEDFL